MNKPNSTENVISVHLGLGAFTNSLVSVCTECFSSFPPLTSPDLNINLDILFKYLKGFWMFDHKIPKIIGAAAKIAQSAPLQGLNFLHDVLPVISMDVAKEITDGKGAKASFANILYKNDWKNIYLRIAARTLSEITIAHFMKETLRNADIQPKEVISILDFVMQLLIVDEPKEYSSFHLFGAEIISESVYILSEAHSTDVMKFAFDQLYKYKSFKTIDLAIYLSMFSQYKFPEKISFDEKTFLKIQKELIKVGRSKETPELYRYNLAKYLINFYGEQFNHNQKFVESPLIYEGVSAAMKFTDNSKYVGEFNNLHSFLMAITEHPKLKKKTPTQYLENFLVKKINIPNMGRYILQGFVYMLRGKHYLQPYECARTGENFNWNEENPKVDDAMLEFMFSTIIKNSQFFTQFQRELSDFLLQFASLNIPMFTVYYMPLLIEHKFMETNSQAMLLAMSRMISRSGNFPDLRDCRKYLLEEATKNAFSQSNKEASNHSTDPDDGISVAVPVLESLEQYVGDDDMVSLHLLDDCYPTMMSPPATPSYITISKLKDMFSFNLSSSPLYQDLNTNLIFDKGIFDKPNFAILQSMSILPLIEDENIQRCLTALSMNIFSKNKYTSVTAMRSMQALILQWEGFIGTAVTQLFHIIQLCEPGLAPHNLFKIVYQIDKMMDIIELRQHTIPLSTYDTLQKIAILGLCSASYPTRQLSFKLLTKCPFLSKFFKEKEHEISLIGFRNAILSIDQNYDPSKNYLDPILFSKVVGTAKGVLYRFYLASFASALRDSDYSSLEDAKHLLKRFVCLNNDYIDIPTKTNLIIFYICSHSKPFDQFQNVLTLVKDNDPCGVFSAIFSVLPLEMAVDAIKVEPLNWVKRGILLSALIEVRFSKLLTNQSLDLMNKVADNVIKFSLKEVIPVKSINSPDSLSLARMNLAVCKYILMEVYKEHKVYSCTPFHILPTVPPDVAPLIDAPLWYNYTITVNQCKELEDESQDMLAALIPIRMPTPSVYTMMMNDLKKWKAPVLTQFILCDDSLLDLFLEKSSEPDCEDMFGALCGIFNLYDGVGGFLNTWAAHLKSDIPQKDIDFTKLIYLRTGKFIALGLFFLMNNSFPLRHLAFSLLLNICVGTTFVQNSPDKASKLLMHFESIRYRFASKLSKLCLPTAINLSTLISDTHQYCSEQFVYSMFQLIQKYPHNPELGLMVAPWISAVRFDLDMPLVFSKSDFDFVSFTCYSFVEMLINLPMSSELIVIIDRVTNDLSEDGIGTLEFLIQYIIFIGQFNKEGVSRDNCSHILSYILTQRPEEAGRIIKPIFSFSLWYYMNIQIKKDGNDEYDDENEDEDLYVTKSFKSIVDFTLKTIVNAAALNSDVIDFLKVPLISFSLIHAPSLGQMIAPLMSLLFPLMIDDSKSIITNIIKEFTPDQLEEFGTLCLTWGVCCCDIEIANRGLNLYAMASSPTGPEIYDCLLNSLQYTCKMIDIVMNKKTTKKQDAISRIIASNAQVNTAPLIKYVSNCLNALQGYIEVTHIGRPSLFYTAASFLACTSSKSSSIVKYAIKLMQVIVEHPETRNALISNDNAPSSFKGLMRILADSAIDRTSMESLVQLLMIILENDLSKLYAPGKPGFAALVFILIPLSSCYDLNLENTFKAAMSTVGEEDQEALKQCNKQTAIHFIQYLGTYDIRESLLVLEMCMHSVDRHSLHYIFQFCYDILHSNVIDDVDLFAGIASRASDEKSPDNSFSANLFLQEQLKHGGKVNLAKTVKAMRPWPIVYFEDETLQLNDIPQAVDFSEPNQFTPLFFNEDIFSISEEQRRVLELIKSVRSEPFTTWDERFSRAQSIQISRIGVHTILAMPSPKDFLPHIVLRQEGDNVDSDKVIVKKMPRSISTEFAQKDSVPLAIFMPHENEFVM